MSKKKEPFSFTEEDKEMLVDIVKMAQKRQSKGSKGSWKEFLAATDKKHGANRSDPAKRPWQNLAAFVQTFTAEQDIQMVKQIKRKDHQRKKLELLDSGVWVQSPEQRLVQVTRNHPCYTKAYSFPSYNEGWAITKLGKADDPASSERMISLDCEMVICEHGEYELVRVCAVDHDCQTLLDLLIKPLTPVIDYLTSVTGVSAEDLKNVTCSPADAQKKVLKLLSPGTILVGHSLYHDLRALKIDHARVIDTAFIFQYCNRPESYTAGLDELCKAVLGHGFREEGKPHDCLKDAIIPMQIVLYKLKHDLNEPLDIPSPVLDEDELSKLYLHNIPASVSIEDLQDIFPKQHNCEIQPISWNKNKTRKTYALFSSSSEANDAFEKLCGKIGMDSSGRPEKTVAVCKTQKFVKVRKMSPDIFDVYGSLEANNNPSSHALRKRKHEVGLGDLSSELSRKKLATYQKAYTAGECDKARKRMRDTIFVEGNCTENVMSDEHTQELEELKEKIKQQDAEIESLQRIIVALIRKQGL